MSAFFFFVVSQRLPGRCGSLLFFRTYARELLVGAELVRGSLRPSTILSTVPFEDVGEERTDETLENVEERRLPLTFLIMEGVKLPSLCL